MNEVEIITLAGDPFWRIRATAMEIVKTDSVSRVIFNFNECRLFVTKESTIESINNDYDIKLKQSK